EQKRLRRCSAGCPQIKACDRDVPIQRYGEIRRAAYSDESVVAAAGRAGRAPFGAVAPVAINGVRPCFGGGLGGRRDWPQQRNEEKERQIAGITGAPGKFHRTTSIAPMELRRPREEAEASKCGQQKKETLAFIGTAERFVTPA